MGRIRLDVIRSCEMDTELLKNLCVALEGALAKADDALDSILESLQTNAYSDPDYGEHAQEEDDVLWEFHLERCCTMFAVTLEALGLSGTRQALVQYWQSFKKEDLYRTQMRDGLIESHMLTYLRNIEHALKAIPTSPQESIHKHMRDQLIQLLRSVPHLIHKRGVSPGKESDVQDFVQDYLEAYYPTCRRDVELFRTSTRTWKVDFGIRELRILIEYKYATTEKEARVHIGQLHEDVGGYSGSKDWDEVIAVIYQTGQFLTEAAVNSELKQSGAKNWTAIVVGGTGDRLKGNKTRKPRSAAT